VSREIGRAGRYTSPEWMRASYCLVLLSKLALGGTEPTDLCGLTKKTELKSLTKTVVLSPHPSLAKDKSKLSEDGSDGICGGEKLTISNPAANNYEGWDTKIVRRAVRMEDYLDRFLEICKYHTKPNIPIPEKDRERYKRNNVAENSDPDLFNFGVWLFTNMKEWYLGMIRREEEIDEAIRDATSATPSTNIPTPATTNTSITTPGEGAEWVPPPNPLTLIPLRKRWDPVTHVDIEDSNNSNTPANGTFFRDENLAFLGSEIEAAGGDDFWGAIFSSWPGIYGGLTT